MIIKWFLIRSLIVLMIMELPYAMRMCGELDEETLKILIEGEDDDNS